MLLILVCLLMTTAILNHNGTGGCYCASVLAGSLMFPFVCVVQGVTVAPMALKCHEDNKVYRYKQNTEYGYGHQQVIKTYYKEMIVFLIRF